MSRFRRRQPTSVALLMAALVLQCAGDGGGDPSGWKDWIATQTDAIGSRATIVAAGATAGLKDGLHAAADGLHGGMRVTVSAGRAAYAEHGPLLREKGAAAAAHLRAASADLKSTARKASSTIREAYSDAAPVVRSAMTSSVTELKALRGWVGEGYTDLLAELEIIIAEQRGPAAARGGDGSATTEGKRCSFASQEVAEQVFQRAAKAALAHGECRRFTQASAALVAQFADGLIDTKLPACAKIPELLDGFNGAYSRRNVKLCVEGRSSTEL